MALEYEKLFFSSSSKVRLDQVDDEIKNLKNKQAEITKEYKFEKLVTNTNR